MSNGPFSRGVRAFLGRKERIREEGLQEQELSERSEERGFRRKLIERESTRGESREKLREFAELGAPLESVERGFKLSQLSADKNRRLSEQDTTDIKSFKGFADRLRRRDEARATKPKGVSDISTMSENQIRLFMNDIRKTSMFNRSPKDQERLEILESELDSRLKKKPKAAVLGATPTKAKAIPVYKSAEDVKASVLSGNLSREEGLKILKEQFKFE